MEIPGKSSFTQEGGFINNIQMINKLKWIAYGDPVNGKWNIIKTNDGGQHGIIFLQSRMRQ